MMSGVALPGATGDTTVMTCDKWPQVPQSHHKVVIKRRPNLPAGTYQIEVSDLNTGNLLVKFDGAATSTEAGLIWNFQVQPNVLLTLQVWTNRAAGPSYPGDVRFQQGTIDGGIYKTLDGSRLLCTQVGPG